ncbi:hypothetical protein QTG54_009688 [Skeletonema marinoi]|uniref:Uncharacterized protein n=1 Tax=Skeletonema marinoi TaxID=267567 RepID=A0AAD8Y582_9STRA|nr:hypothetical protein QTG54_009688 [Skeletonema marinoi]
MTSASIIEPFLEPLDTNGDYILPTTQYIANAAILVIFAYLVALVIMEINYFRFAVWMAWRRMERLKTNEQADGQDKVDGCLENNEMKEEDGEEEKIVEKNCTRSVSSYSEMSASSEDNQMMTPSRKYDAENDHSETQSNHDAFQIDQGVTVVTQQQQSSQQNHRHSSIPDIESSSHSAIGHLLDDVRSNLSSLQPTSPLRIVANRSSSIISIDNSSRKSLTNEQNDNPTNNHNSAALEKAYQTIHTSSLIAILASLTLYTITATCMALFTRGLKDEVVAVIVGFSKFVASVIVFILSAKVPQWIGVYHQGAIRLAKCSSNLSIHFMNIDLTTTQSITKLRHHVLLGVSFHFAKFYILLLPFYCGVRPITIPFSIITGSITGFVLMWCIFLVHERNRNRRNIVAFFVIFICSVMSSLLFVRGMAWIQVIWGLTLMEDENAILVTSFFGWLVFMMGVHALFVWHTLRMERRYKMMEEGEGGDDVVGVGGAEDANGNDTIDENKHSSTFEGGEENRRKDSCDDNDARCHVDTTVTNEISKMKKTSSYDSFLFDPRFQDGFFRGYKEHSNDTKKVGMSPSRSTGAFMIDDNNNGRVIIETTPVVASSNAVSVSDEVAIDNSGSGKRCKRRRRPDWCAIFMCNTPEYTKMSCFWKMIGWIKIVVIAISYLLCLYFVAVALGATRQIANTKENLPAVRKALYETQNEGPVCAFDNRGAASNITTFENKDAAHDAGFLIVHCGACGACSNWENLIIEYTTRNNMATLANKCAMRGLFGGRDETTKCITEPAIGFTGQCALCWTEDIVCTKKHCSYMFLQSQITNSVGNFAVGPDDITSATCEEAHCEVGQFVPCVGATRRRMNIISSIPRPVEEQCQIVDVDWRELFAEYE